MRFPWLKCATSHCVIGIVLAFWLAIPVFAADREYVIKALFMYNFLNYITWPGSAIGQGDASVTICVYGQNPFGKAFAYVQKKNKSDWNITIKKLARQDSGEISSCHMLFVSNSEKHHIAEFKEKISGVGVLTVSDIEGFATNGGIIEFAKRNNKIKLVINAGYLKKEGFKASSKLMKIAKIVGRGES